MTDGQNDSPGNFGKCVFQRSKLGRIMHGKILLDSYGVKDERAFKQVIKER